jgi:glycosyltransferase involved in cell wall biosynthesis
VDEVTVVVATYGDRSWQQLAESRAVPSALDQAPVIRIHGETLHDARNAGLAQVRSEWVVFLDADDELEPGYIAALISGTADLCVPSVRYITPPRLTGPVRLLRVAGHEHPCTGECLPDGNFMVIGTLARAEMLRAVGGWRDFPWSEDWDLWLRCWRAGATIETLPEAVYRAHVRADSRNRGADRAVKQAAHEAIHRANYPELYLEAA